MSTIERIIPDEIDADGAIGDESLQLHLQRYRWAAHHVGAGDRVLDMACGVGYGSQILAAAVSAEGRVTGVDVDAEAIAYAEAHYLEANSAFHCADVFKFGTAASYDAVVSLETIEHVPDPDRLIHHLAQLLFPGGVLVASVPVTPSVDINPHHQTDFSLAGFRRRLRRAGLVETDIMQQRQPYNPIRILRRADARLRDARPNLAGYYLTHPGKVALRAYATLRFGFQNRYATIAARKAG